MSLVTKPCETKTSEIKSIATDGADPLSLLHLGDMAAEQALITAQINGRIKSPQVMFWQYDQPGIILGCSQKLDDVQIERAAHYPLPYIRRGSGGGAVLAGPWMLSVTLFIPNNHQVATSNIIEAFAWVERIWLNTLRENGIDCRGVDDAMIKQSKEFSSSHQLDWACYGSLSHGEVVCTQGNKLLGLAQIRKRAGVILVSGLNLAPFDWLPLCDVVSNRVEDAQPLAEKNSYCSQLAEQLVDTLLPAIIQSVSNNLPPDFNVIHPLGE